MDFEKAYNDKDKGHAGILELSLSTSLKYGLSEKRAAQNLEKYGPNIVTFSKSRNLFMVYLLDHLCTFFTLMCTFGIIFFCKD